MMMMMMMRRGDRGLSRLLLPLLLLGLCALAVEGFVPAASSSLRRRTASLRMQQRASERCVPCASL